MKKTFYYLFYLLGKKNLIILFILSFYALILTFFEILSLSLAIPLAGLISGEVVLNNYQILNYLKINITPTVLLTIFCFTYILKVILFINFTYNLSKFSNYSAVGVSNNIYRNYLNLPFKSQIGVSNSSIVRTLTQDIWSYSALLTSIVSLLSEVVVLFFILLFLLYFNWKISTSVVFVVFTFSVFYVLFFKNKIKIWSYSRQKNRSEIIKILYSSTHSLREIKMYFKQKFFFKNFKINQKSLATNELKVNLVSAAPRHLIEVVVVFVVISIFFLNLKFGVIENIMSIMAIFVLAAIRIIPSLSRIISALQNYRYNLFSAKLFYDILFDKHKKNEQFIERKKIKINKSYFFKKNIIFSDVSFYYNPENIIFENINLKINKSDQILIKGKSGIGKSTFLDLLTGLQNPKSGKILIDSKYNIIDFDKLWKLKVGYVAQKNFLLNDTILNNIVFSKNQKNINLKKLNTILENINLKKEIDELPDNLNTIIGDYGGNKLSGGQLQRIALARALYKEPEILILDEGTAALDDENEEDILNYLKKLKITFINCTHKYKNINKYSQIFEIQKKIIKIRKNV